jgi:hypothetical protein
MLTIEFVPYTQVAHLTSQKKITKLLKIVKENKIVLMEGKLKQEEEKNLITNTMKEINNKFKGIEIATINPTKDQGNFLDTIKYGLYKMLAGNRRGLTVIGPATIVKEIRKDPNKVQLLTKGGK